MKQPSRRGARWIEQILPGFDDVGALIARFNLRRVYYWLLLASLVGLVGGIGALVFKWLADHVLAVFWPTIVSFAPPSAGGEPVSIVAHGPIRVWGVGLIVAPAAGRPAERSPGLPLRPRSCRAWYRCRDPRVPSRGWTHPVADAAGQARGLGPDAHTERACHAPGAGGGVQKFV
jgi:hypothetical protein